MLTAVLVVAACGGSEAAPDLKGPLTAAEVEWIRKVGRWGRTLDLRWGTAARAQDAFLAGSADEARLARAFAPLERCNTTRRERAGKPPSRRLEEHESLLREACDQLALAADLQQRAAGDPSLLAEAGEAWDRASDNFILANNQLRPLMAQSGRFPRGRPNGAETRIEPRLSAVASDVVHEEVDVVCPSHARWRRIVRERNAWWGDPLTEDYAGLADESLRRVFIEPTACAQLASLVYGRRKLGDFFHPTDLAFAVVLLAHEIEHVVSPRAEAEVECDAVQSADEIGVRLGLTPRDARKLGELYWREHYPALPGAYRSPECRDGGALDRNPDSSRWP